MIELKLSIKDIEYILLELEKVDELGNIIKGWRSNIIADEIRTQTYA